MKKIQKNILILSGLSFGVLIPFFTTSCASATYYVRPFFVGANTNPWANVLSAKSNNNFDLSFDPASPADDQKTIDQYIPKNYIMNSSNYAAYSYCQPQKILDDTDAVVDSDYNWNLPLLQYTSKKNSNKIASYRNINLIAAMNSTVNSAEIIKSYYNLFLSYLSQPGIALNPDTAKRDAWLNALFGENGFDLTNDDEKKLFYNFIFSKANVLPDSGKSIDFGPSNVDFSFFQSNLFGPSPLLANNLVYYTDGEFDNLVETPRVNYLFSNAELEKILTDSDGYYSNGHSLYIGAGTANKIVSFQNYSSSTDNEYPVGGISSYPNTSNDSLDTGYVSPYTSYFTKSGDDVKGQISSIYFSQVPVLIQPNGIDYTFYNFKQGNTFNPKEWDTPLKDVQSAIKKSKSWKKYNTFASDTPTLNNSVFYVGKKSRTSSSTFDNINDTYTKDGIPYKVDPETYNLLSNVNHFSPDSCIGFANYSCYVDNDDNGDTHLYPFCTGITSVYPTLIFQKLNDNGEFSFDDSLLSYTQNQKIPDIGGYGSDYKNYCTLDTSKIDKKISKVLGFYQKYVGANSSPGTDLDSLYDFLFVQYFLGNLGEQQKTKPSDFIYN